MGSTNIHFVPARLASTWLAVLLIVLVGVAAYANSFTGVFLLDDWTAIVLNPNITHFAASWKQALLELRPLVTLTLVLNYQFGQFSVWGYHLLNVSVHVAAALTLYGFLRRTLRRFPSPIRDSASGLALTIALLWLVHPLQTESVTYVIQRAEAMMALFYLLTLYCVVRSAEADRGGWKWQLAAMVSCALGMASKEGMLLAPLLVLAYDRIFLADSWSDVFRRRKRLYLGLLASYLALAPTVLGELRTGRGKDHGFAMEGTTPSQYAMNQPPVICHYLKLAFWPAHLCLDYNWPPLQHPADALGFPLLIVGALMATTVAALLTRPRWGFLGLWFLLTLGPSSSIMPIKDLAVEHRMYHALAPLLTVVVLCLFRLEQFLASRLPRREAVLAWCLRGLVAALVLLLAVLTIQRNRVYQSEITMWQDVVNQRPHNLRAYNNLGRRLALEGRLQEAEAMYRTALQMDPAYQYAHYNLGLLYNQEGKKVEAARHLLEALRLNPGNENAFQRLRMVLLDLEQTGERLDEFPLAVLLDPSISLLQAQQSSALARRLDADSASKSLTRRTQSDPHDAEAFDQLGMLEADESNWDSALAHCRQAVRIQPAVARYEFDLAYCQSALGEVQAASRSYQKALNHDPFWLDVANKTAFYLATHPDARARNGKLALRLAHQVCQATSFQKPEYLDTLAAALAENGQFDEARSTAQNALDLASRAASPDFAECVRTHLRAYSNQRPLREPPVGSALASPGGRQTKP